MRCSRTIFPALAFSVLLVASITAASSVLNARALQRRARSSVNCDGSAESVGDSMFQVVSQRKSDWEKQITAYVDCLIHTSCSSKSCSFSWDWKVTNASKCPKAIAAMRQMARKFLSANKDVTRSYMDSATSSVLLSVFNKYNLKWSNSDNRAKFESVIGSCKKLGHDDPIALSYEETSTNSIKDAEKNCKQVRGSTTMKSGAEKLKSFMHSKSSTWLSEMISFFGCLVPVVKKGSFTHQGVLSEGAKCNLFVDIVSAVADPYASSPKYALNNPLEITLDLIRKEGKKIDGDEYLAIQLIWETCTPKKTLAEMGKSEPPLSGTDITIEITVGPGLPKDMAWPFPSDLVPSHTFCFDGVVQSAGNPYLGSENPTSPINRSRKTAVVSLAKFDPHSGYACKLADTGMRYYKIKDITYPCMQSIYFKKLPNHPWHLVIDNSIISDCPYEFIVPESSSEARPKIHLQMRKDVLDGTAKPKPGIDYRAKR